MHPSFTLRSALRSRALLLCIAFFAPFLSSKAQITVTNGYTATQLASMLTGSGVAVFGASLTCPDNANGKFHVVSSSLGFDSGIVLTSGAAVTGGTIVGVNVIDGLTPGATSNFASTDNSAPGDADLTTLAGVPSLDACILEFDFKPAGDSIKFQYVFGSEEYTSYTCSPFNDVFGFLISGGVYGTPTNLARVPGTTIPVCINSVNCGPTGGYTLPTCTALGPGSPFCAYYVNNFASTTSFVTYDGITTPLTALAAVNPCDTYHLKLGIADATDRILDSGVFLKAGSLSSDVTTAVTSTGTSGLPYCIRGCAPGNFIFSRPNEDDSALAITYVVSGTAVNGYDYSTIGTTIIIPADEDSAILNINTLIVPAAGPKVVTITIMVPDPCTGALAPGATSSLTILDSFTFRIITPDTAICRGEYVQLVAVGDSLFDSILNYTWTPGSTLSNDTVLNPIATPTITTTYTLTGTTDPALGCAPKSVMRTISIFDPPTLTIDSALVLTCVGVPVQLHATVTGYTVQISYSWSPGTDLSSTILWNPYVTPSAAGDIDYVVSVYPTAAPLCVSRDTIRVHAIGNIILHNGDTAICRGESVQVDMTGSSEYRWLWTPSTGVSNTTIMEPIITPTANGTWTVTASYANCPDKVRSFSIEVDTPAIPVTITDTICLGMTFTTDLTVPGSTGTGNGYYHYQWIPSGFVSNDTIPNPIITPTTQGTFVYTVTVAPHAISCAVNNIITLEVLPNTIDILNPDTTICFPNTIPIATSGGHPVFTYQWLPTAGVDIPTITNPLISPDTSATYFLTAHFYKCPDIMDSIRINVQHTPTVTIGPDRKVCEFDTIRITASVLPAWQSYTFSWTPGDRLDDTTLSSVIFKGDSAEVFVTVSTSAGCKSKDSASVFMMPGNFASLDPQEHLFCPHDTFTLMPTGGISYKWSPEMYLSDANSPTPVIKPITSQLYTVVATDAEGCTDTLTFNAIVHPGAVIYLGDSVTIYPGESYQINPQTNCTRFAWFPPAGLSNAYIADPLATPETNTRYIVKASTEWGCTVTDTLNIYVDPDGLLAVPNAFTPGSGVNNEFKIIKRGLANLNYFRIFNRWGNLIFETKDIEQGWNGEYKGTPQPFGVYVYEVQAVTKSGKIFTKQGNVTLIR